MLPKFYRLAGAADGRLGPRPPSATLPRCTAILASPPIEIYPPKTSPAPNWIMRFILSFRNFHLEGLKSYTLMNICAANSVDAL
ncbi:unnamed protein product [Leptosia nina]|uniref:Uncharacterized protein n=1 Tax=Leptosia nina TaxID=320188 RepID=A0AAV1JRR4_9NEOP